MLTEPRTYRRSAETSLPYPSGLLEVCTESWLDGPLGKRKVERLERFHRFFSHDDSSRDEVELLIADITGDADDYRLVDIRLPIDPYSDGCPSDRRDGYLLRYSNDSCTWSGEYYIRTDFVRVSVALDDVDVNRLVDYHVAGRQDARCVQDDPDHPGELTTGQICFPRM